MLDGMFPAATASDGVVVAFVTVGTSQLGQDPDGAATLVTPDAPVLDVVVMHCQFVPSDAIRALLPVAKTSVVAPLLIVPLAGVIVTVPPP